VDTVETIQPGVASNPQCPVGRLRKCSYQDGNSIGHTECPVIQLLQRRERLLRPKRGAERREQPRYDASQAVHPGKPSSLLTVARVRADLPKGGPCATVV
jgi:hypothetical protein